MNAGLAFVCLVSKPMTLSSCAATSLCTVTPGQVGTPSCSVFASFAQALPLAIRPRPASPSTRPASIFFLNHLLRYNVILFILFCNDDSHHALAVSPHP